MLCQRGDENTDWLHRNGSYVSRVISTGLTVRSTLETVDKMDASNEPNPGCNPTIPVDDPDRHKRESARTKQAARRAQMSQQQKDEINRKRRETKLQNKIQSSNKENNNPGMMCTVF
ncbi:unnamed protein product [Urochloa humidicola]